MKKNNLRAKGVWIKKPYMGAVIHCPCYRGKVAAVSRVEGWEVREGGEGMLGRVSLNPERQRAITTIEA